MMEPPITTRRHWLELVSTVVVLFVSIVSLWVAVRSEDANNRMVAASSWPFLQIKSGNQSDDGMKVITLSVENAGVGPAKIKTFEVFWKGQAFSSTQALLRACCMHDPKAPFSAGTISTLGVLRAGDHTQFLRYKLTPENKADWQAFDQVRYSELIYRACYCSVFDECRLSDLRGREQPVKACPKPPVSYVE